MRDMSSYSTASVHSDLAFHPAMGWTSCIILFLYASVCECRRLPDPEPLMHGAVQSPQYPEPYPPNLQEQWDLSVPEGYQIRLTFTHLDIESSAGCYYDSLTVRATFQHMSNPKLVQCCSV
ncbi:complement component 1, r subcomponent [Cottoperca gobio]|uniref:Complement component 1, r subcomponent n=1 Tax=Cottoperca gobio TaxID=56716 RepID=A0A6J2R9J1_COTGO|nr:calcium-dependent serine proteinase-like [Cottoperca gobio]